MKALKVFCAIPYVFLVMLIEWRNCPTGMVEVEIPLFCISAALLGVIGGLYWTKLEFRKWSLLQAAVSGICVLLLAQLPFVNKCGNVWATYFKPFTAIQFFFILEILFWLIGSAARAIVKKIKA
jgi:hypothetical protein